MSGHSSQRIFGLQVISNLLEHKPHTVRALWVEAESRNPRLAIIAETAAGAGIKVQTVQATALKKLAGGGFHQGVLADIVPDNLLVQKQLEPALSGLANDATVLLLDGVQDPHNLGACLRSAETAGVALVIIPLDRAADLTPVARRAASGAAELLPVCRVTNVARAIRSCQQNGFWVVGTSDIATELFYNQQFTGKILLVMGSEAEGMRRLTMESCDQLLSLPMSGKVSSLNVSVATGVCLFEIQRQRLQLS